MNSVIHVINLNVVTSQLSHVRKMVFTRIYSVQKGYLLIRATLHEHFGRILFVVYPTLASIGVSDNIILETRKIPNLC